MSGCGSPDDDLTTLRLRRSDDHDVDRLNRKCVSSAGQSVRCYVHPSPAAKSTHVRRCNRAQPEPVVRAADAGRSAFEEPTSRPCPTTTLLDIINCQQTISSARSGFDLRAYKGGHSSAALLAAVEGHGTPSSSELAVPSAEPSPLDRPAALSARLGVRS